MRSHVLLLGIEKAGSMPGRRMGEMGRKRTQLNRRLGGREFNRLLKNPTQLPSSLPPVKKRTCSSHPKV
jgi:hypothetical protein